MQQVGKYQLVRKLATGGMAEVFLAKAAGPMGFEKTLVLKRILPHLAEEPAFVQMFLTEAKLAARLTHPHIVQIFDFGQADGAYFLAMEYIDGPSLRTLIKNMSAQGQSLPPEVCARLVAHACEGLAFAHDFMDPETGEAQGLIHRDISPDNILLSRQGAVKVVDFGIAKAAGQSHQTQSGVIKGKLAYMPPEQLRAKPLDRRVDVYALGVVLYELLTGRKPYVSDSDAGLMQAVLFETPTPAAQLRPGLPTRMLSILERAMAKERDQRYADCHALQSDLEEFILSLGKLVTTQHVAQLIAPPASRRTDAEAPTQWVKPPAEPTFLMPPEAAPPLVPSEQPTVAQTPPAPLLSENDPTPLQRPAAKTTPRRMWRVVVVGGALLVAGSGVLRWRMATEDPPRLPAVPTPLAHETPAPIVLPAPHEEVRQNPKVALAEEPHREITQQPPGERLPHPEPLPHPLAEKTAPAHEEPAQLSPPVPPASKNPRPLERDMTPKSPPVVAASRPPQPPGFLDLRVRPFAIVFVDEKEVAQGPPFKTVELPAGPHALKLVNAKLEKIMHRSIYVKSGETFSLRVNLLEEQ